MFTEILEYIGGYILKKTAKKYVEAERTIKLLHMDQPEGDFAKKMARLPNRLYYPVPKLQEFFNSVYMLHSRETSKQMKEIDFKSLILDVASDWRFQVFVDYLKSESDDSEDIILGVCHYMTTLLVKILSHNYAKYRLQQIQQKSTKYSKGLRGDLKAHTC